MKGTSVVNLPGLAICMLAGQYLICAPCNARHSPLLRMALLMQIAVLVWGYELFECLLTGKLCRNSLHVLSCGMPALSVAIVCH